MKDPNPSGIPIRVISHNIRYATTAPFEGEKPWSDRRRGLISQLRYHTRNSTSSPFICLQEVLHEQLEDIHTGLNVPGQDEASAAAGGANTRSRARVQEADTTWSYIGVGRDDGKTSGEYSPIFYRQSDYTLLENSTVWLSETPSKPSRSWDAASTRILTIGIFKHITSKKIVLAMNTHLDDQGSKSREESAKIILKVLRDMVVMGRRYDINGAFLAGDLNSEESDGAYKTLNAEGSGLKDLRRLVPGLSDPREPFHPAPGIAPTPTPTPTTAEKLKHSEPPPSSDVYGNENTFTGFTPRDTRATRIDFIHLETADIVREKEEKWNMDKGDDDIEPWRVEGYSVLPNRFDDGVFISDHRAVVGDLVLRK